MIRINLLRWDEWDGFEGLWVNLVFHLRGLCPVCKKHGMTMHHLPEAPGSWVGRFIHCGGCGYQRKVKGR